MKLIREGTFLIGVGVGRGVFEIFGEKSRDPPTSWDGLTHDPSQTPTQKHLTIPPPTFKTEITGSENNEPEVLFIILRSVLRTRQLIAWRVIVQ